MCLRRLLILPILIAVLISGIAASGFEISGGIGVTVSIPYTSGYWSGTGYYPFPNLTAELRGAWFPHSNFGIGLGIRYKGQSFLYTHQNNGFFSDIYAVTDRMLEFPMELRIRLPGSNNYEWQFGIGGFVGWWFSRTALGYADNQSTGANGLGTSGDVLLFTPEEFTAEDNRFTAGLSFEVMYGIKKKNDRLLRFSLRYDFGLTDMYRDGIETNRSSHYTDSVTFLISHVWDL